jgi:hypothetical protein
MRFDLGTVPDWIGGVGAFLAFGFAAVSYGYDRSFRRKRDRAAEASLCAAWISVVQLDQDDGSIISYSIEIVNRNHVPMVSGSAIITFDDDHQIRASIGTIPPTINQFTSHTFSLHVPGRNLSTLHPDQLLRMSKLSLQFVDTNGDRWTRTDRGKLSVEKLEG